MILIIMNYTTNNNVIPRYIFHGVQGGSCKKGVLFVITMLS